jgi:hypothetical protein
MITVLPYSMLTQGFYSSLVTGISSMTIGIFGTAKSIYNHQNPDLTNFLKKLDIEYQLRLVGSVLKSQSRVPIIVRKEHIDNKSIIFTNVTNNYVSDNPIEISLIYLSKIIEDIHKILLQIDQKVNYHQTKWLSSYRTLNIESLLTQLETHSVILKNRFDDFVKLSSIPGLYNTTI